MLYTCANPEGIRHGRSVMTSSEQNDFVDRVAQAVIDKIEERDETEYLVNQVVSRVIEMQRREAELKAKAAEGVAESDVTNNSTQDTNSA